MAHAPSGPDCITLTAHDMELVLSPEIGGSVVSLTHTGDHILRHAPAATRDVLQMAAFPLVPFSGRIQDGAFTYNGQRMTLPPNMPPEPHAIHGHGWTSAWQITARTETSMTLSFTHEAGDWPWRYSASQVFTLKPDALHVALRVVNHSETAMPAGLGWHPYFPREDATLTCDVTGYWPNTDDYVSGALQPVSHETDLRTARRVDTLSLDNAFRAGGGPAHIRWPARGISAAITASAALNHWIVYTPPGEDFFCAEPVSHAPNALNMSPAPEWADMQHLPPGEEMTADLTLSITRD